MTTISGFTFIKNGLTLGYPIAESIRSIEALCDEIIINVGFEDQACTADDGTFAYLTSQFQGSQYIFLKSFWDPEIMSQGLILSQQTNIALDACTGDFCQYIQGDEAIHEDDIPLIQSGVEQLAEDDSLEGLIFQYRHFYGNTDILKETRNTYRREVRLIRNHRKIKSHLDAQGFKGNTGQKLKCLETSARVFHYGWARASHLMNKKVKAFSKLYHGQDFEEKTFAYKKIWGLKKFNEAHPKVMKKWIEENKNELDILALPLEFEWKNVGLAVSDLIESLTGYRLGEYKNFIKARDVK